MMPTLCRRPSRSCSRPAPPRGVTGPGAGKSSRGGTADSHDQTSLSRSTRDATVCRHPVVALDVACRRAAPGESPLSASPVLGLRTSMAVATGRRTLGVTGRGGGCRASRRGPPAARRDRPLPVTLSAGRWYARGCPEFHWAGVLSGPDAPQTTEGNRSLRNPLPAGGVVGQGRKAGVRLVAGAPLVPTWPSPRPLDRVRSGMSLRGPVAQDMRTGDRAARHRALISERPAVMSRTTGGC